MLDGHTTPRDPDTQMQTFDDYSEFKYDPWSSYGPMRVLPHLIYSTWVRRVATMSAPECLRLQLDIVETELATPFYEVLFMYASVYAYVCVCLYSRMSHFHLQADKRV